MDLGKINKRRREEVETDEEREDDRDVGQIPITNPIDQVRLLREKYLIYSYILLFYLIVRMQIGYA